MNTNLQGSRTHENLMKAFAGESQARNRYTFAASCAKKQNLYVIEAVFKFTADQEKEHAEIFYNYLNPLAGKTVTVDGTYPVDINNSVVELLKAAQHNEFEEYDPVYKSFAETAKEEGFGEISATFNSIAKIEKTHGERFGMFADLLTNGKLFVSDAACKWMCLNCGHIFEGTNAPEICPVCRHDKGYFIRLELAPFTKA